MVDILQSKVIRPDKLTWYMLVGDKTDIKPAGEFPAGSGHTIANGSRFFENKTEIRYEYNDGSWNPVGQVDLTPPADGKTRLYCNFEDLCLSPVVGFALDGECIVDWGDSTTPTPMAGTSLAAIKTATHTYSEPGKYVITVSLSEGSEIGLGGTNYGSMLITPGGVKTPLGQGYRNSLHKLVIGSGVNLNISSSIRNSYSLVHVELSDDIDNISDATFFGCMSLVSIVIPESVSTIGGSALANLHGLTFVKFVSEEPPTLSASNAFEALPRDCVIYVPEGTLEDYTSATNYPDDSVYTYVEY